MLSRSMLRIAWVPSCEGIDGGETAAGRPPRSALMPCPSAFRLAGVLACSVLIQNLLGQLDIALRSAGTHVIQQDGLAETGRFRQADITRNHGLECLVAKVLAKVGGDLL